MPAPLPSAIPAHQALVMFGPDVPSAAKGPALLAFERALREHGADCSVFMETMRDQNKLRRKLTREDVI
jgi:hypothetical protein